MITRIPLERLSKYELWCGEVSSDYIELTQANKNFCRGNGRDENPHLTIQEKFNLDCKWEGTPKPDTTE